MDNFKPILLVEDNRIDAMAVERVFRDLSVTNTLVHKANGEESLAYLNDRNNEMPCLILLDLNMPMMGGIDFLKIAKADETLKSIPVVVFISTEEDKNEIDSYNLDVADYIIKLADYNGFKESFKTLRRYWASSELPIERKS